MGNGKLFFVPILGVFLLLWMNNASAVIYIDSCRTLSSNELYVLNSSITASVSSSCLNKSSGGNVTIDGAGFGITVTGGGRAISLVNVVNVTIRNLAINGTNMASHGIYLSKANMSDVDNVNITEVKSGSGGGAVYGVDLKNVNFRNSYLYGNNGTGFSFRRTSHINVTGIRVLYNIPYAFSKNGFFEDVSFLNFSENVMEKLSDANVGDQLVHCNGWINDSVFSNNRFSGICGFGALCSIYSVPNRVDIYNNAFSVNCSAVRFGAQYAVGMPYTPISGYLMIHDNRFNITGNGNCFSMSVFGDAISVFNNTCDTELTGASINIIGNLSSIFMHDNVYKYVHENMSHLGVGISVGTSGLVNARVVNFTIANENMVMPFPLYGLNVYNVSMNISNSNISGLCAGVRTYGVSPSNIDVYHSQISSLGPKCPALAGTYLENMTLGDVNARNASVVNLYNSTLSDSENITAFDNGTVNAHWNLDVNNPLSANVKIYDRQNNLVSEFFGNNALWARQFFQNASGRTDTTPHKIEASKEGYLNLTTEITMDRNKQITLNLVPVCMDNDGDGYGIGESRTGCTYPEEDCNDTNPNVHPAATEICNGVDDNCDNQIDDGGVCNIPYYCDSDGDGYKSNTVSVVCGNYSCVQTYSGIGSTTPGDDYDDSNPAINPGATEICNGIDDNCNGLIDENLGKGCGEGVCAGTQTCSAGVWNDCSSHGTDAGVCAICDANGTPAYDETQNNDCTPTACPSDGCGVDTCEPHIWGDYPDSVPNECSTIYSCTQKTCGGNAVCGPDNDNDGWSSQCGDCNENDSNIHPEARDPWGDGIDQNCDELVCGMKKNYSSEIECTLTATVVVNNDEELADYMTDYGFDGSKYKNLKIACDISQRHIDIHSPCKITLKDNVVLTADTVCLDGRGGILDDNGYTVNASRVALLSELGNAEFGQGSVVNTDELRMEALKTIKIGLNSIVDVGGTITMNSTGDLTSSESIIKDGSEVTAGELIMEASRSATVGQNAKVNVTGDMSIASTRDYTGSQAEFLNGAKVTVGGDLSLTSGNKALLGLSTNTTVTNNFHMNAQSEGKCTIKESATYTAGSMSGNCLS